MATNIIEIFQYGFMQRALIAGSIIGIVAPVIGIFLVLRRYSLIADTLSHVSLAGVALGLLFKINPIITAMITTATSSILIEKLRLSKRVSGESALSLFLSGSLALAVVLIGLVHGFGANLFSYLFGSIVTVTWEDVWIIGITASIVLAILYYFYNELRFITFDEEAAQVSGIKTNLINLIFILISSVTISLAIPVVGVLLISALIVIPVVTAQQFRQGFKPTLIISIILSLFTVLTGIFIAYFLGIATGGAIVLLNVLIFGLVFGWKNLVRN